MSLKVEVEYVDSPDEAERIKKVAKILAEGVYSYLKKEGYTGHIINVLDPSEFPI